MLYFFYQFALSALSTTIPSGKSLTLSEMCFLGHVHNLQRTGKNTSDRALNRSNSIYMKDVDHINILIDLDFEMAYEKVEKFYVKKVFRAENTAWCWKV